jgi:cytochrome c oxidase cbb3-type subunit I/II
MYIAGFMQGLMWQDFLPDGTLVNKEFLSTVDALKPYYMLRSLGGLLYLTGAILMFYNLIKTAKSGSLLANEEDEAIVLRDKNVKSTNEYWHRTIERKPIQFMVISIIVVAIGGLFEIIPTLIVKSNVPTISSVKPYTALELEGRDLYIREGCYNCHSQMVRPLRFETVRYGEYSKSGEFVYDHPFQWGSKRTGPDLAREGGLRSNFWHFQHMIRPKDLSPGSIMPAYTWMNEDDLNLDLTEKKINAMRTLGVPYPERYAAIAVSDLKKQALVIATDIVSNIPGQKLSESQKQEKINSIVNKEIIAMIAYLQRLGTDIKPKTSKK